MTTEGVWAGVGHNTARVLGPRSRAEFARAQAITPGGSMRAAPFFPPHPPYAASGSGAWITDADGQRIFDCANNFFSLIHGHSFEPVAAALRRVLQHGTAYGLPTPERMTSARRSERALPNWSRSGLRARALKL